MMTWNDFRQYPEFEMIERVEGVERLFQIGTLLVSSCLKDMRFEKPNPGQTFAAIYNSYPELSISEMCLMLNLGKTGQLGKIWGSVGVDTIVNPDDGWIRKFYEARIDRRKGKNYEVIESKINAVPMPQEVKDLAEKLANPDRFKSRPYFNSLEAACVYFKQPYAQFKRFFHDWYSQAWPESNEYKVLGIEELDYIKLQEQNLLVELNRNK